jgi:hypothetical protein
LADSKPLKEPLLYKHVLQDPKEHGVQEDFDGWLDTADPDSMRLLPSCSTTLLDLHDRVSLLFLVKGGPEREVQPAPVTWASAVTTGDGNRAVVDGPAF